MVGRGYWSQAELARHGFKHSAALFYGDSMITPAISVLSAVEGLELAFDGLEHWVVQIGRAHV